MEPVVLVTFTVETGGMMKGCCWELTELEEYLLLFIKPPEEGEAVHISDFTLECYNASVNETTCPRSSAFHRWKWCRATRCLAPLMTARYTLFGASW